MTTTTIRLLTIDLDDTLWPCAPVIRAAEDAVLSWLAETAPRLAAAHDHESLRQHRRTLMARHADLAHDLSWVRRAALAELLEAFGYPPGLAEEGFALFCEHRNRVEPYPDVAPALRALATQYRLVSMTNGNADVARSPLAGLFDYSLTAVEAGAAKPHPAIFHRALEWAGVQAEETLHVGDDPELDVAAARRCGIATVWVNRGQRTWPAGLEPPSLTVTDLHQLRHWLARGAGAL